MTTVKKSSNSDGRKSRSGKTSKPWKRIDSHNAPLSQAASPVKIYPLQAKGRALKEKGPVCGKNFTGSFARLNRDMFLWKTLVPSEVGDSQLYSRTWPRSGTMRNGIAYQLPPLVPLTKGTASGSWATPTLCGNNNRKGVSKTSGDGLATQVKMWPTPTARDWRSDKGKKTDVDQYGKRGKPLTRVIGGQLNPTWVEWLLGLPTGWTDLNCSATARSFRSLNGSGKG